MSHRLSHLLFSCSRYTLGLKCPVTTIGNANYASADSMTSGVSGTCIAGYGGSPKADCTVGGTWDLKTACTRNVCSGRTENGITWPPTDSFGTATGSCQSGYTGAPQRVCTATGEWSDTVVGTCTRAQLRATYLFLPHRHFRRCDLR